MQQVLALTKSVLFYVLFVSMCTILLTPSVNPIAVKYIVSYHIISKAIILFKVTPY